MSTSDGAIASVVDDLTEIRTQVVSAANPQTDTSFDAIKEKINKLIDEIVNLGNTQIGDRYVFGGQKDDTQPFKRDAATGLVTYSGTYDGQDGVADAGTICMKVSPGDVDTVRDKVNIDGAQLFGPLDAGGQPEVFTVLNKIITDINNQDSAAITADLGEIDRIMDNYVLPAQTTLGSRQSVYQTTQARLKSDSITIETDRSNNEDINEAKASIDFSVATNVYNATLAVGAKLLPYSLVDYLK
jgi:Flagellin and related hook-associated proteins